MIKFFVIERLGMTLIIIWLKEPFGYDKYLARWFGFYCESTGQYMYQTISSQKQSLTEYLDSLVGVDMLTAKERKPLIERIGLRDYKGKLQRSLITINQYMESENLPYTVISRRKTKMINGAKKNYPAVWTVIRV